MDNSKSFCLIRYLGVKMSMRVTKVSPVTGKASSIEIPVYWREYVHRMIQVKRGKIQSISLAFPELDPYEVKFLETGKTFQEQEQIIL